MEKLFKRHFWIVHALLLGAVAVVSAKTASRVAGHYLAEALASDGSAAAQDRSPPERADNRNFAEASEYNIFQAFREVLTPVEVGLTPPCQTDADCEDGLVCSLVENPAPGEPAKQCQPPDNPGEIDFANAVPSELPLKLVGTSVFSFPEDSLASILDKSGGRSAEASLYSVNECEPGAASATPAAEGETEDEAKVLEKHLKPQAAPCNKLLDVHTLLRIDIDRIYLQNSQENRTEFVPLEELPNAPKVARAPTRAKPAPASNAKGDALDEELGAGISKTGPNSYAVKQDEVNKALANLSQIATKARIVPAFEGGQAIGFKLFSIRPGSIYSKIGIQNGDIIQKVNGYEISSPDKALEVYQKLKEGKEFSVDIKRRGKPVTLTYDITP